VNEQYVPIFVESSKYKIIVFGGGNVALRKCRYFQGADITVMTREILPDLRDIVTKVIIGDIPDDVKDIVDPYDLVIAATDDKELNARIRNDAAFMGISVNSAHGGGNVLIPSVLKRDKYTVAVSSQGRVPAFPPYLIEEIDSFLDSKYDRMLDLMIEMRAYALENISPQHKRREFLESVIYDADIQAAVADDRMKEAKKLALKKAKK
jgi:siroheme synthase-like protein